MSRRIKPEIWGNMLDAYRQGGGIHGRASIPQQLLQMGYPITIIAQPGAPIGFSGNIVHVTADYQPEECIQNRGCLFYHGYWSAHEYLDEIKDIILDELRFPKIEDDRNLKYAKMIQESNAVCLHIRRGDFVNLGWALPPEVFVEAIRQIEAQTHDVTYFVFSDNPDWCRANIDAMGLRNRKHVIVEGNLGLQSFRDMQLMSMCKHFFLYNSTFSVWAHLLCKNEGVTVRYE